MDADAIRPYSKNPFYWQYRGRPVLLLGGSVEDNLFQIPDIKEHLDLLASVGGNYVRCTMSSRDPGNVWPFERDAAASLYDLNRPSAEFWGRFERFLRLCEERDIVAQAEVWATFDFYRGPWQENPFNPKNNSNYAAAESGLPEAVETHPVKCENPFFFTVPAAQGNRAVLPYQEAFVKQMLSISLRFPNVLYCMDNETSVTPEWGAYWARLIRAEAEKAGTEVHTTEMWDKWDLTHPQHANTFDNPGLYTFVDVSQNNHQQGQTHWDNFQAARKRILDSGRVRPMNCVKIYGANTGCFGTSRDGQERFWRNVIGGAASARFHRPNSGLGLSPKAQANIRSARMLADAMDVFECEPRLDLLRRHTPDGCGRSPNEAYCMANPGKEYAVFFPDGGMVTLDLCALQGPAQVRWLDIPKSEWRPAEPLEATPTSPAEKDAAARGDWWNPKTDRGCARLATPEDSGYWAALVQSAK